MRSNCIDCLDRTNALQTLMGLDALGFQLDLVLERLGYLERYGRFSPGSCAYVVLVLVLVLVLSRVSWPLMQNGCTNIIDFAKYNVLVRTCKLRTGTCTRASSL